ncbi:AzlD domain-containing protein [Kiloniella laminariae]|uniref:AzlD domain-containing protein n=1 Tax=Kiloniella laminariae TaxID=454162 RepID=A0ABT4LI26_9PROT|nr:AzlD domain-containing protein [Kiloniella laminariae]MCZ4279657.1 AzlD domain-containing protein [Kiloniella laminariae]
MTQAVADIYPVIFILALATFSIRLSGVLLGQRLPQSGRWARGLKALPGCLIISLVSVLVLSGGPREWLAGAVATAVALLSRSLPLTMATGIATIWLLRHFF